MYICKVEAEIRVDDKIVKSRVWPECDIMKTSVTRGWTTRQFNNFLRLASQNEIVTAQWFAIYGEAQGYNRLQGRLSGVHGNLMGRWGVFES